jgi:hypothetical protein
LKAVGIALLVIVLAVGVGVVGVIGTVVGAMNADNALRTTIAGHERTREASFDTMKKIITQKTQLPAAAKADLLALLPEVVSGRSGGTVFKSVQERYPEFTLELYKDISRAIESERHTFFNVQKELFAVKQAHDELLGSALRGTILSFLGRKPVEVKVISSTEAKEVVRTGVDDNTDLNLTRP